MEQCKEYHRLFSPLWDGYEVGRLLGSGSFGDVYELKQTGDSSPATEAVKEVLVPPASAGGLEEAIFQGLDAEGARYYYEGMKQKALDEVAILQQFSDCPTIVQITDHRLCPLPEDCSDYGWVIFFRMELLQPFKEKLLQDGITLYDAAKLTCDLCTALEACHERGILHRDIKPENIFYSPITHRYKLGDFGIACYISRLTEEKGLPGTLTHMAPEVFRGAPFDYSSDLYAVGMILYKLLNHNRVPLLPDYPQWYTPVLRNQAIRQRLAGATVPLPSITRLPEAPVLKIGNLSTTAVERLAAIATKAIAADRKDRYASPTELREALTDWLQQN